MLFAREIVTIVELNVLDGDPQLQVSPFHLTID